MNDCCRSLCWFHIRLDTPERFYRQNKAIIISSITLNVWAACTFAGTRSLVLWCCLQLVHVGPSDSPHISKCVNKENSSADMNVDYFGYGLIASAVHAHVCLSAWPCTGRVAVCFMCLFFFYSDMERHFHTHILPSKNKAVTSNNGYFRWSATVGPLLPQTELNNCSTPDSQQQQQKKSFPVNK